MMYPRMTKLLYVFVPILLSRVKVVPADYVVHNITLTGPNTPLVFSSLPFLIHTPTVTSITRVNEEQSTNAQSSVHGVINNLLKKGRLLYKGVLTTTTSTKEPNVKPNQPTTQEYVNTTSNPAPTTLKTQHQPSHSTPVFTQPQPSHATPVFNIKSQEIKRKANFLPYLHMREHSNKSSVGRSRVHNYNKHMITLGTVKHKTRLLNDTMEYLANDSRNSSHLDLDELERFLHIRQPDMIKPLIYYRTNNDTNDTSNTTDNTASTMPGDNQQPDINIVFNTEDPTLANLKDKGKEEAFLCVTKCPHTVLSIEMYIEGNRRICTGNIVNCV
uniref:Uncharacterized protein n=1 Tax=Cacopsylla melanoneura TaxID=428564 RepID=A0A8D9AQN3_9HEMI